MSTLSFHLDDDLKSRLDALVESMGLNKSRVLREAISEKIEELEEVRIVMERLKSKRKTVKHEDLMRELGLDH